MSKLKKAVKQLFKVTNTLFILDKINYTVAHLKHNASNKAFKKAYPDFALPSDYFLYETYKLDYRQYREDGDLAAREISEWTAPYLPAAPKIMEWGCGVSRIIRNMAPYAGAGAQLFACDINAEMIGWNKQHIKDVSFLHIGYTPPTPYGADSFNMIYALSVFTHIEDHMQNAWIEEIARILLPGGIFLFTTHGSKTFERLDQSSLKALEEKGAYTMTYPQKGHKMMSTYNTYEDFAARLKPSFDILEFYSGKDHPGKVGGQDMWIVRKKAS